LLLIENRKKSFLDINILRIKCGALRAFVRYCQNVLILSMSDAGTAATKATFFQIIVQKI
jgi:hypothetical protein